MKKIKIFVTLIFIFLTTACTVDYKINIKDQDVNELISFFESDISKYDSRIYANEHLGATYRNGINSLYNIPRAVLSTDTVDIYENTRIEGTNYYDVKVTDNDILRADMKSALSLSNLEFLNSASLCYDNFQVLNNNGQITISTGTVNKCFTNYANLESIHVILETDYKVISSNADSNDSKQYTWIIDTNNYNNKSITFTIEKEKINNSKEDLPLYLIIGGILLITGILVLSIYLLFKYFNNKNNKL